MWTRWLGTFALCTLAMGCQLANNAVHNLTYEAKLTTAEAVEHCNYEKLARASWDTVKKTEDGRAFSSDYADGYKEGFVDYLQFGGSGQPPYVPPKRFWGPRFRTPKGYQAVEEWNAGFRHGASAALESGYRQWVTLPSAGTTDASMVHPGTPIDPIHEMPAPGENRWPAPPQPQPTPKLLRPDAPRMPTEAGRAPGSEGSMRPLTALGGPIAPFTHTEIIQLDEPAQTELPPMELPTERPNEAPKPVWTIEVVNPNGEVAPRPSLIAPGLTPPNESDLNRRPNPAAAPGVAPGQILIFPPARATFGPPVPIVMGWTSMD